MTSNNAKNGMNERTVKIIKINTFKAIIEDLNKDGLLEKITKKNNKKGKIRDANESERATLGLPTIIYNKLKLDTNNIKNDDVIKREVDKNIALFNAIVKNIPPPNNNNKNMETYLEILANPK